MVVSLINMATRMRQSEIYLLPEPDPPDPNPNLRIKIFILKIIQLCLLVTSLIIFIYGLDTFESKGWRAFTYLTYGGFIMLSIIILSNKYNCIPSYLLLFNLMAAICVLVIGGTSLVNFFKHQEMSQHRNELQRLDPLEHEKMETNKLLLQLGATSATFNIFNAIVYFVEIIIIWEYPND